MSESLLKTAKAFTHNPSYEGVGDIVNGLFELFPSGYAEEPAKEFKSDPAHGFLNEAAAVMEAKAKLRDTPGGERTAGKIADVFNALTGHNLTEADAWLFLIVLKLVRSRNGKYNRDDYVDLAAYSGLAGEHASTIL